MADKKKKDDKSGPSTGGKVTSRMKDTGKKVPVTSVTPKSTVSKPSKKQVAGTRKVVAAAAAATPAGRAGKAATTAAKKASEAYGLGKMQMLKKELTPTLEKLATGKIKWENLTKAEQKKAFNQSAKLNKLRMKFESK